LTINWLIFDWPSIIGRRVPYDDRAPSWQSTRIHWHVEDFSSRWSPCLDCREQLMLVDPTSLISSHDPFVNLSIIFRRQTDARQHRRLPRSTAWKAKIRWSPSTNCLKFQSPPSHRPPPRMYTPSSSRLIWHVFNKSDYILCFTDLFAMTDCGRSVVCLYQRTYVNNQIVNHR